MKYALSKDHRRRQAFLGRELRSLQFRALLRSQPLSPPLRLRLYPAWGGYLEGLPGRIRNRCFLTGRSGSPQGPFRLSRQTLRSLANGGLVSGLGRSSWLSPLPSHGRSPRPVVWFPGQSFGFRSIRRHRPRLPANFGSVAGPSPGRCAPGCSTPSPPAAATPPPSPSSPFPTPSGSAPFPARPSFPSRYCPGCLFLGVSLGGPAGP
jgi:ribosomal protein S14